MFNVYHQNETRLHKELRRHGITDLYICGLCTDICVGRLQGSRLLVTAIGASRYSGDCAGRAAAGLQDNTGGGRVQGHRSGEGCCYSAGDQGEPRAGGQQQGGGV